MSAAVLTSSVAVRPRWIINKQQDLAWFIGSALAGYAVLAILVLAKSPTVASVVAVVWATFINGPHFCATATRTYFDSSQLRKRSLLLLWIIPLTLLPFLLVSFAGKTILFVFAAAWGTYHVAKQHLGFVMLYKRANKETADFKWDRRFLLLSQLLPLGLFLIWYLYLPTLIPFKIGLVVQIGVALFYVAHQAEKYRAGEEMNWPKLLLLSLVVPLHWLALVCAVADPVSGVFIFTIAINIGHALQYHRLMWFHNHNRYQTSKGFAAFLSRRVTYYYSASLALYLLFFFAGSIVMDAGPELLIIGAAFMHYVLDARIWKTRDDPELAKALRMV